MQNSRRYSTDYRARYTTKLLHDTLVQMLREMPMEKISISALCTRAKISRSTFYMHYSSTQELLQEIEDIVFQYFKSYVNKGLQSEERRMDVSNVLFMSLREKRTDYPYMFLLFHSRELEDRVAEYIKNILVELCVQTGQLSQIEAELWAINRIGGTFAIIKHFHERDFADYEMVNAFFHKLRQHDASLLDTSKLNKQMKRNISLSE